VNHVLCNQVERALTLVQSGLITIESIAEDPRKDKKKPKSTIGLKKSTAKVHSFCDVNWGYKSRSYMKSIAPFQGRAWDKILKEAQEFVVANRGRNVVSMGYDDDSDEDERALLVNLSNIELESCEYCYSPPDTFIDITIRKTPAAVQNPFLVHEGIEKVSKLFLACLPSSGPQFSNFFPNRHTYIPHTSRSVETEICGIYCSLSSL